MKTHIQKLMLPIVLTMVSLFHARGATVTLPPLPDVRAFVILPTGPNVSNGVIDLLINAGEAPYQISYYRVNPNGSRILIQDIIASNNGDEDLQGLAVGNYIVDITDLHCRYLSLNVIVSLSCNCDLPLLHYDNMTCELSWENLCQQNGAGYSYVLQQLSGTLWTSIITNSSVYKIPAGGNGQYRISVSKIDCPTIYSDEVTTSCIPSACTCNSPVLNYDVNNCKISWSEYGCLGYNTTLQRNINGTLWENAGVGTSPLTVTQNGRYRLKLMKPSCAEIYSSEVEVICNIGLVSVGSLIINEFSQGCSGVQEYIELLVTGDTPLVSVEGMIIDDNNHLSFEQGNESGHIRLGSCFSSVPVGTIILLYNGAQPNPNIGSGPWNFSIDDPCIVKYPNCPDNHLGITTYNCAAGGGNWQGLIPLYNLRDVVQVRNPNGSLVEAIIYGGALFTGTGGNIITIPNSSNQTLFQRGSNTSWTASDPCNNSNITPGVVNNKDNKKFIEDLTAANIINVLPNPATEVLNIISLKPMTRIEVLDFSSKQISQYEDLSVLSYTIDIKNLAQGIHIVRTTHSDGSSSIKKFFKIR